MQPHYGTLTMRQLIYSLLLTSLTACGQTGPLYLPQEEPGPAVSEEETSQ